MDVRVRYREGKQLTQYNCKTQREAESQARQADAILALGVRTAVEEQQHATLAEYCEGWLTSDAEVNCRPSTVAHYRIAYTDYFKPQLGALRLDKINRTHIKAFVG